MIGAWSRTNKRRDNLSGGCQEVGALASFEGLVRSWRIESFIKPAHLELLLTFKFRDIRGDRINSMVRR